MIAMRMMKMAIDQVVDMVAVRNSFVSASGTVDVACFMPAAVRRALIGIFCANFDPVLVDMVAMRVMQMAVVQIVDVIAVPDRGVPAVRSVLVIVMCVMGFVAGTHGAFSVRLTRDGLARPHAPGRC